MTPPAEAQEQWGPWVEHDGKGCPCKGMFVRSEDCSGRVRDHIAHGISSKYPADCVVDCWDWHQCGKYDVPSWKITRYRVRKPRALVEMIQRVEALPSQPERVDA